MKKLKFSAKNTGLALMAFGLLATVQARAQYNVEIKSSTQVYITGGSTVSFKGINWISASDVQGTGPVIFNGSSAQNINMNNLSISGITVQNTNHVNMLDSMTVANTNLFTTGNLLLNNYRITLNGKVEGQGGTGRFVANGNSSMVFAGTGGNDTFFLSQTTPNTTNRLKNLTLNRSGATVACGDTAQVRGIVYHLNGTINANKSRLKLKYLSSTQYGQVAGIGSGTISDTMYTELIISDNVQSALNQWRHLTSPLKNATLTNELSDDITIYYTPISNANVWTFDQSRLVNTWRPVEADEEMHNNDYAVFLWPTSYGLNPTTPTFMVDINGTYPGTGNFSRTLARTNPNDYTDQAFDDTVGWHMIANPYPSNISCPAQTDLEGGSSYYIWDISGDWRDSAGCGGCKARATYATYRADNGLKTNGGRSVIPPFHVFYVRAAVDNASFTVNNSWRTTDSMYNNIGRKGDVDYDRLHVKVKSHENVSDELYLWFDETASNNFDRLDGLKLMNDPYAPNIYTLSADKKKMVFNVLKEVTNDFYSVEMPFVSKTAGQHTLTFDFENGNQVSSVQLEDRKTGKLQDVLANDTYVFTHDTGSQYRDRFVLHFRKSGTTGTIEDYLTDKQPIQISTDSRNIIVRFPYVKEGGAVINVYDMLGRQVMEGRKVTTTSEIYVLDGSGLASGYYTVKVQSGNEVKSAPVVISK